MVRQKKAIFLMIDIKNPNYLYAEDAPCNIQAVIRDIMSLWYWNKYTSKQHIAVRKEAVSFLLKKFQEIHDERKNEFALILSYWIRISNVECINILDYQNIFGIIIGYRYRYSSKMIFNRKKLILAIERYMLKTKRLRVKAQ